MFQIELMNYPAHLKKKYSHSVKNMTFLKIFILFFHIDPFFYRVY